MQHVSSAIPLALGYAIRRSLREVPGEDSERPHAKLTYEGAYVACPCRRAHRIGMLTFHRCTCGIVFTRIGKTVFAARLP